MGVMSLIRPNNMPAPNGQVQAISPGFGEVYDATLEASELGFQSYSRDRAQNQALEDRDRAFEEKTGQKIADVTGAAYSDSVLRYAKMDEVIEQGRKDNPDVYGSIPTSTEVQQNARNLARTAQTKADGIKAEAGGFTGVLSSFAGEFVAGAQDPTNAAAMLIGGGEAKGAIAITKEAAKTGAANAGVTALAQPSVAAWQEEIGNEYGMGEAVDQVGMAFMFGGVAEGGQRAIGSGFRFARTKTKEFIARRGVEVPTKTSDEVFPHLLNQESGNTQVDAAGAPITSPKGATGAAQVMPDTGPEAAKLAGLPWDENKFKTDKEYNTALGKAYFDKQLDTYGSPEVALLAYNAGPGAVSDFMHGTNATGKNPKGIKLGDPKAGDVSAQEFVRKFPFKESRDYATKIMGNVHGTEPDLAPYMHEAQSIKEVLGNVQDVNESSADSLKKALGYKPESFAQFIKKKGGIRDEGGELAARDINHKSLPGLVRKSKEASRQADIEGNFKQPDQLDYLREAAFDAGYFPDKTHYDDIDPSDFYDALAEDLQGRKRYTGDDMEKIAIAREGSDLADQYNSMGITHDMTPEEIAGMLHSHDVPDEFAVHDTASRYFEAIASSKETPAWARSSYSQMAEYADAVSTSPFERDTPINRERHMQNLAQADAAVRSGVPVKANQLDAEGVRPRFSDKVEPTLRERKGRVRRPVSSREVADVLKPEEAKQFQATQRRDFEQRVDTKPEETVLMEDGRNISMKELREEIAESERHIEEIKTCGLG